MQEPANLLVFKKSHELVLNIYAITKTFPIDEQFGLTSQIRRAATSIPSNIAEGKGRGSAKDFKRFLLIARGSLEEIKYKTLLAKDLHYITEETYRQMYGQLDEIGKLLGGLIKSVDAKII